MRRLSQPDGPEKQELMRYLSATHDQMILRTVIDEVWRNRRRVLDHGRTAQFAIFGLVVLLSGYSIIVLLMVLSPASFAQLVEEVLSVLAIAAATCIAGAFLLRFFNRPLLRRLEQSILDVVSNWKDPNQIGALALACQEPDLQPIVSHRFGEVLPNVTQDIVDSIGNIGIVNVVDCLYLRTDPPEARLAVVRAIGRVLGMSSCEPAIRRLNQFAMGLRNQLPPNEQLAAELDAAAVSIRARIEDREGHLRLLRAVAPDEQEHQSLLRTADELSTPDRELLRPAEPKSNAD